MRPCHRPAATCFEGWFQQLEDRRLLTVFTVDTLIDDASGVPDNYISLREAVIAAETNAAFGDAPAGSADGDRILFHDSLDGETVLLTWGQFEISDDLAIGAKDTRVTIDADGLSRIFQIDSVEKFSFTNMTLRNGSAVQGGAISLSGGGTLELTDMAFAGNAATFGGGALFNDESDLIIGDSAFRGNQADGADGQGGAIFSLEGRVHMYDTQVSGNLAVRSGGALHLVDTEILIEDSVIRGHRVQAGNGGGVAAYGTSSVVIDGGWISSNSASLNGGGVWIEAGTGRLIVKNQSSIVNNQAQGNAAGQGGGGIYNEGALVRIMDSVVADNVAVGENGAGGGILSADGTLNIRRSHVRGNSATVFGGGIGVIDGFARLEDTTLGGQTDAEANAAGLDGGGLHVSGVSGTTVVFVGTTVWNNQANRDGGGVWIAANTLFRTDEMSAFQSNRAGSSVNGGGGIFNDGGALVINETSFFNNSAVGKAGLGGAIHSLGGKVMITNSTLTFNHARRGGGAISQLGGSLILVGSVVSTNLASGGDGGGVYVAVQADVVLDQVVVSANSAHRGGGLAAFDSTLIVKNDSRVLGNEAASAGSDAGFGGGIYTQTGLLRILDSAITDNRALPGLDSEPGSRGGGLASLFGTVNVRNSSVVSNTAGFKGGGIYVKSGVLTVQDSVIGGSGPSDANTAFHGGGIYVGGQTSASITGSQVRHNTAVQHGGGIFNHPLATLQISAGTLIQQNSATRGGGVYNAGLLSLIDSDLLHNEASIGAGLSNQPAAIAVIDTADISGNAASFVGAGVQNAGILSFVGEGAIFDNIAEVSGGGLFTDSIGLTFFGDVTISSNKPDDVHP
jgi:hypothetical protein